MASTLQYQYQPGDQTHQARGTPVHATIRRIVSGVECVVTPPDYRTQPIPRVGVSRYTLYVEGLPGETFAIEMCYKPVFLPSPNPQGNPPALDVANSKWVTIGTAKIPPAPFKPVVKQTFEDLGYCFRVTRTAGSGGFSVHVWTID